MERKDEQAQNRLKQAEEKLKEAEIIKKSQLEQLERISELTVDQARQQLLDTFARAKEGCCSLSDLQIDGRQLLKAGCPKGKKVGEILNQLLEECMQEVLQNHTEKLIERAKQLF